ncbi:MAG: crossover junction endodeoxyribonuclease RuvC [Firmicutes bacterium]|nr:crossover junction endodeoxyribonuclease RuvC [[Eubacterium] siraeum]MCM1488096.1 crossover junction endodeoxyribonuclease RuvC [Bacillota bacterium]
MRIIGIDPGYAIVGFGIIEYDNGRFKTVDYGAVTTRSGTDFNRRLEIIYADICQILDAYKPESLAIEKLYFQNNQKTAIDVAEARGVILLAAIQRNILIREYTPLEVKKSITGYGQAVKKQVQEMTKRILHLPAIPKPDDTADALAIAICHAHTDNSLLAGYGKSEFN